MGGYWSQVPERLEGGGVMEGKKRYKETTIKEDGCEWIREFVDMDGGIHFKWTSFSINGKFYPVGSFDVLRYEEIDWSKVKEI